KRVSIRHIRSGCQHTMDGERGDGSIRRYRVGYSVSSSTLFPSIRYTGRVPSDPLGMLQGEATIFAGLGSQVSTAHRWGDYSAMQIDPTNNCIFWYTNQYEPATGSLNWHTRALLRSLQELARRRLYR